MEFADEKRVQRYARIRYAFAIADFAYLLALLAILQFSGLAAWLSVKIQSLSANYTVAIFMYISAIFSLYFILDLPLSFYRSFIVERRFGLSSEKFLSWFRDVVKSQVLSFAFFLITMELFLFFLKACPGDWWWITASSWILISVILARIFPVLIIPLFFKYKKLENEGLRERILALSERMGIKVLDLYEIDFSKKTVKANAGLVGLGRSKRVILTDTLRGKFSDDEIEMILAHEFAHSKLKHLVKLSALNAALTFLIFYLFFKAGYLVFNSFGLAMTDIAGLGVWIFLFAFIQVFFIPAINWISRNMERNADIFALRFGGKTEAFITMLEKLTEQNLSERKPSLVVKIFFFTHPPVEERLALARGGKY